MSIKKFALVAAALVSTASIASANNSFNVGSTLKDSSVLDLGLVRSEANGVVNVYDFGTGVQGALLGSEAVHAGANTDVRVDVTGSQATRAIAVLEINGQPVVTKDYMIIQ